MLAASDAEHSEYRSPPSRTGVTGSGRAAAFSESAGPAAPVAQSRRPASPAGHVPPSSSRFASLPVPPPPVRESACRAAAGGCTSAARSPPAAIAVVRLSISRVTHDRRFSRSRRRFPEPTRDEQPHGPRGDEPEHVGVTDEELALRWVVREGPGSDCAGPIQEGAERSGRCAARRSGRGL